MGNGRANDHCRNFVFAKFLVFTIIQTVTSFYFKGDPFFQQGFFIPLKKMAVSGGEDIGCRRWSNQQDFEHEMGLQPFITDNMNSQVCLNYCRIKVYQFAAVSEGRKCWCGDENGSLQKASRQFTCNVPCAGNVKYRCGGGRGHFQLFKIITPSGKSGFQSSYVGCYKEDDHEGEKSRQFLELFSDTIHMTIGRCVLSCHSRFRKYAALQRGTQCWCGDNPLIESLLNQMSNNSFCNIPCINKMTTCGGERYFQVYAINYIAQRETPFAMYVGCFKFVDGAKSDLKNVMYDYAITKVERNDAGAMSISRCCYLCMAKKKPYAGLLHGDTCYCSIVLNSRRETFRYKDNTCNHPCTENKMHFCGGDAAMQVYKLRPLGYEWETFGFHIETR